MAKTANSTGGYGVSNECGVCRRVSEKTSTEGSQQRAVLSEKSERQQMDTFWIQCDVCDLWYHGRCVNVEEYESALIEKFHCGRCIAIQGPTIMKETLLDHRYAFEDATQLNEPTQIGTKRFIEEFKKKSEEIPLATDEHLVTVDDGYQFARAFNKKGVWKQVYLITSVDGLGIQLPNKGFSLKDCVEVVGANRMVDTIDVYKQYTYQMSFGRFYEHFMAKERPRLYNILSLEFSDSKMSQIVQPPKVVAELSWVRKFWPQDKGSTPVAPMISSKSIFTQHLKAKPEVELFCLVGMKDSYTDFHIDFGGSSVWYHVFEGQKVFYVVAPTEENLVRFTDYQNSSSRAEVFFGDLLPDGSLFKVVINAGETLMIPSGWIHAVWTPCDSLVFGGNFLHSQNIEMQLRVYEMEVFLETEDRFMFPSFELVNWYAAASFLKLFRETSKRKNVVEPYLLSSAKALTSSLKRWIARDERNSGDLSGSRWYKVFRKLKRAIHLYEVSVFDYLPSKDGTGPESSTNKTHCRVSKPKTTSAKDTFISESAESEQLTSLSSREEYGGSEKDRNGVPMGELTFYEEVDDSYAPNIDNISDATANTTYEGGTSVNKNGDDMELHDAGSLKKRKRLDGESEGDEGIMPSDGHNNMTSREREKDGMEPANVIVEEEVQASLMSMFSHRSMHGRLPKPNAWITAATAKPIVCDSRLSLETVGTPTAKKIPPPHDEMTSVNRQVEKTANDVAAEAVIKKPATDKSSANSKKKKPSTARERLARKLNLKY